MVEYKEYFFKEQRSLWDRFMFEEDIENFYNFARLDNPNEELKQKMIQMVNN